MRLPARFGSLARVARRPGRRALTVVALAGAATAFGVLTGSSDPPTAAKRPARPSVWAQPTVALPVVHPPGEPERVAKRRDSRPRRGGRAHYRRTARSRVPPRAAAEFLPLYREAERSYGVNWRLIASIHRQETAFSAAPSTYHGLNDFGCCAGPMQFNVTNGPISTWELYRQAFRTGRRPARYPHRTRSHPSIYDDFDAIMAAGWLLSDAGAGPLLDGGAWSAAYAYYGHDLFGITYASEVLARAEAWQRGGFCPNCGLDVGLVTELDSLYGASVRRELIAAERRRKQRKHGQRGRDRKGDRDGRRKRGGRSPDDLRLLTPPAATRPTAPSLRPGREAPGPTGLPPTPPTAPAPSPAPPATPPAGECRPLGRLLGCPPPGRDV